MTATTFIGHFLGPDTHSNRPSATGLPNGTIYVCTTHGKLERVVSGAWADYATLSGAVATDTIWDAKGDLAVGTGADTAAKLTVGADGQVLTADSTQTTGAKWAAPGGGPLTLLSTTTLSGAGTFDVSSISGSFNDLIVVAIVRGTAAAASDNFKWNFNGDTGGNYSREFFQVSGSSSISGSEAFSGTSLPAGVMPAATALANSFAVMEMTIFGYASTGWLKAVQWQNWALQLTSSGNASMNRGGGLWNSTAAINRVQLAGFSTANLATGSQLRIYGRT